MIISCKNRQPINIELEQHRYSCTLNDVYITRHIRHDHSFEYICYNGNVILLHCYNAMLSSAFGYANVSKLSETCDHHCFLNPSLFSKGFVEPYVPGQSLFCKASWITELVMNNDLQYFVDFGVYCNDAELLFVDDYSKSPISNINCVDIDIDSCTTSEVSKTFRNAYYFNCGNKKIHFYCAAKNYDNDSKWNSKISNACH
ncbi:hypothetical protein MHBO_004578, partial [Bonamia ostreae]